MAIYVLGMVVATYAMLLLRERIASRVNSVFYVALIQAGVVVFWPLLITLVTFILGVGILLWVGKFVINICRD